MDILCVVCYLKQKTVSDQMSYYCMAATRRARSSCETAPWSPASQTHSSMMTTSSCVRPLNWAKMKLKGFQHQKILAE